MTTAEQIWNILTVDQRFRYIAYIESKYGFKGSLAFKLAQKTAWYELG